MAWPKQSECDAFYGNPRNRSNPSESSPKWESENLVRVKPPFAIYYEGRPVRAGMSVHRKVADSLSKVFALIWEKAGQNQATIDAWGVSNFAGAYNYRMMRGSSRLSMHSWGCAIDLDPDRNAMGDTTPNFANVPEVVAAFESEGWVWGGHWSGRGCDGMHFQAAVVG